MKSRRLVIDDGDDVDHRRSLALIDDDGSEVWRVKPPNGSADRWTDARLDGATVTAFSWSCYRVTIDVTTGAELSREFSK